MTNVVSDLIDLAYLVLLPKLSKGRYNNFTTWSNLAGFDDLLFKLTEARYYQYDDRVTHLLLIKNKDEKDDYPHITCYLFEENGELYVTTKSHYSYFYGLQKKLIWLDDILDQKSFSSKLKRIRNISASEYKIFNRSFFPRNCSRNFRHPKKAIVA